MTFVATQRARHTACRFVGADPASMLWGKCADVSAVVSGTPTGNVIERRGQWLCMDLLEGANVQWEIFDATGRLVFTEKKPVPSGASRWSVDLPPAGLIVVSAPQWTRVVR